MARSGATAAGSVRRSVVAWSLMALAAVVMIVAGASRPADSGASEERVIAVAKQLRCLQCNGENVASSSAAIAIDMRREITRQLADGRTEDEILNYFADRYDRDILLIPPSNGVGVLLWVVPVATAAVSIGVFWFVVSKRRVDDLDGEVSAEDRSLVDAARTRRAAR